MLHNKRLPLNIQFFADGNGAPTLTIYDYVSSTDIVAYWEDPASNRISYMGEELWPERQKLGLDIRWVRGGGGVPIVLSPSAFDAVAQKRDRIGFVELKTQMPFFKQAKYVNEELRQQLNMILETGNENYIRTIVRNIFDDLTDLLDGAAAQRERMRMQALTTGYISIAANGQNYDYDYLVPDTHRVEVAKSWSDTTADIISDIREWLDLVEEDTGTRPARAVCSRKTFGYLRNNTMIRNAILGNNSGVPVSDTKILDYIADELGLEIVVYSKKYRNEEKQTVQYVPDDMITLFPAGALGTGWFGTTPEQSDLTSGLVANVTITDVGVAVTTSQKVDPVNVETKASMIYLPSFEQADKIIIASVIKADTEQGE